MWPFAAQPLNLEAIVGPTRIDVVTRVVSPNDVTSPVSGLKAAFVQLEVLERVCAHGYRGEELVSLGTITVGDLVTLALEDTRAVIELPARRAELRLVSAYADALSMHHAVPELVPLLTNAKRGGVLCEREHLVLSGARLRLRAVVERTTTSVDGSDVAPRLHVRDDLAPILLDEVLTSSRP